MLCISPRYCNAQWVEIPDSTYLPDEFLIWFRPGVLNTEYLGCDENYSPAEGLPLQSDFIQDANILTYLNSLGIQRIDKAVPNLNPCRDTISLARRGNEIKVPDFWNILRFTIDPEEFSEDIPNLCTRTIMVQ